MQNRLRRSLRICAQGASTKWKVIHALLCPLSIDHSPDPPHSHFSSILQPVPLENGLRRKIQPRSTNGSHIVRSTLNPRHRWVSRVADCVTIPGVAAQLFTSLRFILSLGHKPTPSLLTTKSGLCQCIVPFLAFGST